MPLYGLIFLKLRKEKLDPSAGGLAGRRIKAARAGGDTLGSDATCRHQLFNISAVAFGTFRFRIPGRQHQGFKTMTAGLALILVNRHLGLLKQDFLYNSRCTSKVNTANLKGIQHYWVEPVSR